MDYLLEVIDEVQFAKITKVIDWLNKPGVRLAGKIGLGALQMFGDAMTIIEFVRWFEEDVMGKNLVYKNRFNNIKAIPNVKYLTSEEQFKFLQDNRNALVSFTSGQVEKIVIPQGDLIKSFRGAVAAWLEMGPGSLKPYDKQEPPWRDMPYEELSQLLTIEVPSQIGSLDKMTTLLTTIEVFPYDQNFVDLGKPPGFRNQDPDQKMMLIDTQTGLPILPDVKGQKITISAIDPNNPTVRYFFDISVPDNNQNEFELRFSGLGCVPDFQSKIKNKKKTTKNA